MSNDYKTRTMNERMRKRICCNSIAVIVHRTNTTQKKETTYRLMLNEGDLLRLILLGERDRFRGCGDLECLRIDRERDLNIKVER